jgi:hypothetical protein
MGYRLSGATKARLRFCKVACDFDVVHWLICNLLRAVESTLEIPQSTFGKPQLEFGTTQSAVQLGTVLSIMIGKDAGRLDKLALSLHWTAFLEMCIGYSEAGSQMCVRVGTDESSITGCLQMLQGLLVLRARDFHDVGSSSVQRVGHFWLASYIDTPESAE